MKRMIEKPIDINAIKGMKCGYSSGEDGYALIINQDIEGIDINMNQDWVDVYADYKTKVPYESALMANRIYTDSIMYSVSTPTDTESGSINFYYDSEANGVVCSISIGNAMYIFKPDGIYLNGTKVTN